MQHAEAYERLSDLSLEPGNLARLDDDRSSAARALRSHLAECPRCSDDVAAWRRTWALVGMALADSAEGTAAGNAVEAVPDDLRALASLRSVTLAAIAAEGRRRDGIMPSGPEGRRSGGSTSGQATGPAPVDRPVGARSRRATPRRRWIPWVAMAAALVIALGAGSVAWTRLRDLDQAQAENSGLTTTMATIDRVLATPDHWVVTLRTPDGTAGGTVAWSGAEIAVVTTTVPSPSRGASYRCWVERDGVRTPIGPMWFSGSTGYWAGPIGGWGSLLSPGARLGVSLIPAGDSPATPVLVGGL
jgi:hypothetical protein